MSKIPSPTEQALGALQPAGLDDAFLSRLTACAEQTDAVLSGDEILFGAQLQKIQPRGISAAMNAELMAAIGDLPFAVDEKIVLFNKSKLASPRSGGKTGNIFRFNIAAAAAVAILGSIAALMLPDNSVEKSNTVASSPSVESVTPPVSLSSNFAPASYNRNLSNTQDEGVVWQNPNQPHRVLRLSYTDKVTMKNEKGEMIQVEQPRTEYVLIPEKID